MSKKSPLTEIQLRIQALESEKTNAMLALKQQMETIGDELKPFAFIKNLLNPVTIKPKIKTMILDTAIAMGTGFISKKIVFGSSSNPIKAIAGNLLQSFVSSIVSRHPETIKSAGSQFFDLFISNKAPENPEESEVPKGSDEDNE